MDQKLMANHTVFKNAAMTIETQVQKVVFVGKKMRRKSTDD